MNVHVKLLVKPSHQDTVNEARAIKAFYVQIHLDGGIPQLDVYECFLCRPLTSDFDIVGNY